MPELPEVETIRRELAPELLRRKLLSVRVGDPRVIGHPSASEFTRQVKGRTIIGLERKGKYLVLKLDLGRELVFHLRLSGSLHLLRPGDESKFERIGFTLSDGRVLSFVEPRILGRVYLVDSCRYPRQLSGMLAMGLEPLSSEFNSAYLARKLHGRRARVKSLLLDQKVCCGVGNIYSDEALFRAGVRPCRPAGSLNPAEVKRLARGLRSVVYSGIRWCGTTLGDGRYTRPGTERGSFQTRLRVFGREGKACRNRGCTATVKRVRFGNRSSYFCPACQA